MAITFGIVAIIAIVFFLLYMKENEKCENLKYDNEKLKRRCTSRYCKCGGL